MTHTLLIQVKAPFSREKRCITFKDWFQQFIRKVSICFTEVWNRLYCKCLNNLSSYWILISKSQSHISDPFISFHRNHRSQSTFIRLLQAFSNGQQMTHDWIRRPALRRDRHKNSPVCRYYQFPWWWAPDIKARRSSCGPPLICCWPGEAAGGGPQSGQPGRCSDGHIDPELTKFVDYQIGTYRPCF